MDRKLKERITGAALLVVAGVVLIPWVLDGQVDSPRVDQGLVIPPPGAAPSGVRTIVLNAGNGATSTSGPPTPANTTPREPSRPLPVEVPARSAPATDRAPVSESPAAPAEAEKETERVAVAPPAAASASAPVPARKVAPDPAAGWAVQVGSFASEANARKLAASLVELEYRAFVSRKTIDGRAMYRVRVGPRATREEAASLAERLKADRQVVRIVEHPG